MKYFLLSLFFLFSCSSHKTVVNLNDIELPKAPNPVGNYQTFKRAGNLIFINQIALKNGQLEYKGKIGRNVSVKQAEESTKQTTLNIIAVLNKALDGDLSRVKQCVQLTAHYNTSDNFYDHAKILNTASNLLVKVFGEAGKHTRAVYGVSSLPLDSPVEIQAIFEVD